MGLGKGALPWFEADATRLHFEEHGRGDHVLVLPGVTERAEDIGNLIDALASRFRVIAPDLPGSGRSEPIPRAYAADFYQRDADMMAALLAHLGVARAHVAGFSDGGEVALLLAVQHPEVARSLLVWGAAGRLFPELAPVLDAIYDAVDTRSGNWASFGEQVKKRYGAPAGREMLHGWVAASRAILAEGGDISFSRAHEIRCPVLLLAGEHDAFCPPARMRELVGRIPRAELIQVEGGGHALHDEQPRWFVARALHWLGRQSGRVP